MANNKDEKFREFALTGNLWGVLWKVCLPLALYSVLSFIFKILDTMMASHISAASVSTVAYLSQLYTMISAIGLGLSVGSAAQISKAYGAGDYELVQARVSSLFLTCIGLAVVILGILFPFTPQFLRLAGTPEDLMALSVTYFRIELVSIVIVIFNNVYIAIERCRGNTKRIFMLNLLNVIVKLGLTALFVYGFNGTINHIALATVLSNLVLLSIGLFNLFRKNSAFCVDFRKVSFTRTVFLPMIDTSYPIMAEKIFFSLGKVIVNSMAAIYGSLTVGALSISGNINGLSSGMQSGFQDGATSIISQNLGAGQPARAVETFRKVLLSNILIGAVFGFITLVLLDPITMLFAEADKDFASLIAMIYRYEVLTTVFLGINAASMAFLTGTAHTKIGFIIHTARVFVFRVPLLWFLQNFTNVGNHSVGIVMLASNVLIAFFSFGISYIIASKMMRKEGLNFWGKPLK